MDYLKKFENVFYYPIGNLNNWPQRLHFDDHEIELISNSLQDGISIELKFLTYTKNSPSGSGGSFLRIWSSNGHLLEDILGYIYKLPDEWYVVSLTDRNNRGPIIGNRLYKCDQLEGLLKCVNDIF